MVVMTVPPAPEKKILLPVKDPNGKRKHHHGHDDSSHDDGPNIQLIAIAVAIVLLLLAVAALGFGAVPGLGPGPRAWGLHHRPIAACPRPPIAAESQPQFNEQQHEIRYLRRQAFRGDFFAQLELANRYEGRRPADKNLMDQVEAAVWYALALANPDGFERTAAEPIDRLFGRRVVSLYDDCRHGERRIAYQALDRLLSQMSTDERDKVRDRVTYVLSTQGAPGFRTIGRLHDLAYGPFGEPPDDLEALAAHRPGGWPDAVDLFERNAVDAYMFDYLAMQSGDQGAYVLLQDLQHSASWGGFGDLAEARARRWVPPYEFYPPDSPDSGVPHSDESEPMGEADRISLYRISELPFKHIADALTYLHVLSHPCGSEKDLTQHDAETFQAMLGRPTTGWLTPLEKVRAIQFAAVNGSPKAQLVLAVMYAQGVGVPPDYARAFHWFQEADRQGSPEAKFAIATYFSEGLAGVADQEKAEAVVHQLDAALSGFRPSIRRLAGMLERVSPGPHRGWVGYVRPEDQYYPDGGDRYGYGDNGPPTPGYGRAPPDGGPPAYGDGPPPGYDPAGREDFSASAGDTRPTSGRRPPPRADARPAKGGRPQASGVAAAASSDKERLAR